MCRDGLANLIGHVISSLGFLCFVNLNNSCCGLKASYYYIFFYC